MLASQSRTACTPSSSPARATFSRRTRSEYGRRASPLYRGLPDFSAFPIIEKDFVYRNRNLLMNPEYRGKIFRKKTGGSTGEPLIFDTSALAQSHLWAGLLLS